MTFLDFLGLYNPVIRVFKVMKWDDEDLVRVILRVELRTSGRGRPKLTSELVIQADMIFCEIVVITSG